MSLFFKYEPQRKKFFSVKSSNLRPEIYIKFETPKPYSLPYYSYDILKKNNPADLDILNLKIFKINEDSDDNLIFEKVYKNMPAYGSGCVQKYYSCHLFKLLDFNHEFKYGTYRIELETLSVLSNFTKTKLDPFLFIRLHSNK